MFRIFTHPESASAERVPPMFTSPVSVLAFIVLMLVTYIIWPFALNAVAIGVARLYRNRPVEFRVCYEAVLRRWRQIFGMIGIDVLVVLGWYLVLLILIVLFAFAVGLLSTMAPTFALWFGSIVGILGFFAVLLTLAPLLITLTFAMNAVVIEERPVIESLVLGFARIFNRREFWRAMLFSLAVGAVVFGASAMVSFAAMLAAFVHLPLLETAIDTAFRAIVTPFAVVLLAVYYFDVRIRREAFDVETGLDRLVATQPA
jgi:hypothetical protein